MKFNLNKILVFVQIFLAVSLTISSSYLIAQSYNPNEGLSKNKFNKIDLVIGSILTFIGKIIFSEKGLVSAIEINELKNTCLLTKTGSICQEFSVA